MDSFRIRLAKPDDCPAIFQLIQSLAAYEQLSHEVIGSEALLREHLFGARPYIESLVVETVAQPELIGFGLFFHNYSTFLTRPGIYLEDLFVLPDYRGKGIGKALLRQLAQLALERGCGRLEWAVLDWNEPSIEFYRRMGAQQLPEWILNRVSGETLHQLAQGRMPQQNRLSPSKTD